MTHIHLATSKRQDHHGSHIHDLKQEENIGKRYENVVITSTAPHPQTSVVYVGTRKPLYRCLCDCGRTVTAPLWRIKWWEICGCRPGKPRKPRKKPRWRGRTYPNGLKHKNLYVIEEEGGNFKVGVSNDVVQRLKMLQCGNPRKLRVVEVFDNEPGLEKLIHITLDHRKLNGEWFRPC